MLRVARTEIQTSPSWGLILECDGGKENKKLWDWYVDQGFTATKDPEYPRLMYASYKKILDDELS
jgi:hypothetical protein